MKKYMEDVSVEDAVKAGRTDTICWDCAKAMRGGCCWSDPELTVPVEGWTASKTSMGYVVHACPEFERCGYGCGRYRTADDYILALEIGLQERKKQLAKLKNTPNLLRRKCASQARKIEKLQDKLDRNEWWLSCHCGE